jgi:hypothetical protein
MNSGLLPTIGEDESVVPIGPLSLTVEA